MSTADREYAKLLKTVLLYGERREDRTGTGTLSMFGTQMRFDLRHSFPLLTTKRVFWKGVVEELLWFLSGSTNIKPLVDAGVHIWDAWADEDGELGPVYGSQWRNWDGVDQIADLVDALVENPYSRRHIVTAWNPTVVDEQALPPCHCLFQFSVSNKNELSCHLYQRSADMFLGVPFNIASYALLTCMLAHVTGLKPGTLIWTGGDTHIYLNHLEQVREQLSRIPRASPKLTLNPQVFNIDHFASEDIVLTDYNPHPPIKGEVSV